MLVVGGNEDGARSQRRPLAQQRKPAAIGQADVEQQQVEPARAQQGVGLRNAGCGGIHTHLRMRSQQ